MKNLKVSETHAEHGFTQFELTTYLLQNLNKFNLKPTTKLVLMYLSSCYNPKHKEVFPKQRTIADKLGISEASVIRAISELHKEGLIISERKYTNRYKFTSKIVPECPENLQVDNLHNVSKKPCKKQAHDLEQIKETKKEPTVSVEDFKILKKYAINHGAKNVNAYVNKILHSGSENVKNILHSEKAAQRNAEAMYNATLEVVRNLDFAKQNASKEIPPCFYEVRKKLKG